MVVFVLLFIASLPVGALELSADGFNYNVINNYSVEITGFDNHSVYVYIPERLDNRRVVTIRYNSFKDNDYIQMLDLSNAQYLEVIGYSSFSNCTSLSGTIIIPESVKRVDSYAFSNCSQISSVIYEADIKVIQSHAFAGCSGLSNVELPTSLEKIDEAAFANCTSLKYLSIPKSVTNISDYAFQNDSNLVLGVWFDSYGYEFAKNNNISLTLLDKVKLGDVNGDNSVNINDVTVIQRYLAELDTLGGIYLHAADVNQDGTVDIADATAIQMYLAEYEMNYPIGEIMTQ